MAVSERFNAAMAVGAGLILLGLAALDGSLAIAPDTDGSLGARIFPMMGAVSVLVLGALETWRGVRGESEPLLLTQSPAAVLGLLALSMAYVWGITHFGYLIATGVAAPLAMWLFGVRSSLGLLLAAVLCPAIYHLIFFQLLGVFPPYGLWFDLLDVLQGY